ncbi:MAG: class I SAM-dependent methyltransferase [Acidobacteria bacterium]|nr:class I SAM-dependent methyltransferase [Acidobacteriota bacterium]
MTFAGPTPCTIRAMLLPYLEGEIREAFDRWLAGTLERFLPPLNFTELRKGVQAVSSLYVERRGGGRLGARSTEGLGKRAALATYYAALHFITAHHAVRMIGPETFGPLRRVLDLGCGTGATGASVSLTLSGLPSVLGIDRLGWAVDEARRTWESLRIPARGVRGDVPLAAPKAAAGELLCFGWSLGEFDDETRGAAYRYICSALHRGASLLVLEPIAGRIVPWWSEWGESLADQGVRSELIRVVIERPSFVRDMDKAASLDHQIIGARVLAGRTKA